MSNEKKGATVFDLQPVRCGSNASMLRATGTTISGMLDSGHYFLVEQKQGTTELIVSDGGSIVARYVQAAAPADLDLLALNWLRTFLAIESQESCSLFQSDDPITGVLAGTNQAIFSRLRGNELTLLISSDDVPRVDSQQSGIAAIFTQQISPATLHEVLVLWKNLYGTTV